MQAVHFLSDHHGSCSSFSKGLKELGVNVKLVVARMGGPLRKSKVLAKSPKTGIPTPTLCQQSVTSYIKKPMYKMMLLLGSCNKCIYTLENLKFQTKYETGLSDQFDDVENDGTIVATYFVKARNVLLHITGDSLKHTTFLSQQQTLKTKIHAMYM